MEIITGKNYYAKEIPAKIAREIVKKYHYSGKVVPNSKLHLGVFDKSDNLVGCLQYGPPMNPKKTPDKLCPGSTSQEMFELNRMVMDDDQPRNSESQAISICNKWVKLYRKQIKYIVSYSDGKEGNVGYIYQATNWKYLGYRVSDSFYLLDDTYFHSVQVWHLYKEKHPDREIKTTHEILFDNFENVSKVKCKQHIYIFPLNKKLKFFSEEKPYPKLETEKRILQKTIYKREGLVLEKKETIMFD